MTTAIVTTTLAEIGKGKSKDKKTKPREIGRWEFEDFDPRYPHGDAKVTGSSGPYAKGFEAGSVRTFKDFVSRVVGYNGYKDFTVEGGVDKKPDPGKVKRLTDAIRAERKAKQETETETPEAETAETEVAKMSDDTVTLEGLGAICKADEEQQVVYGWAYVTHDKNGVVKEDKSGDFVDDVAEIEKTALKFMLNSRAGDTDHNNEQSTTIVESMVFTPEKVEAMGIAKGILPSGWWIGAKCDDATWRGYKEGKWKAFSIHGSGVRKAVEDR